MVERLDWDTFLDAFAWRQGEHVSLIGPTHCGKTTLALSILEKRNYVVAFGTKPRDDTLRTLVRHGWKRIDTWADRPDAMAKPGERLPDQRLVLWPKFVRVEDQERHQPVFNEAMREMFAEQGWTIFADEASYLAKDLQLGNVMKRWWQQGRSIKLTVVAATQRPVWVPPEMYTQAAHLFLWASNDRRDLQRLSDIGGPLSGARLAQIVSSLNFNRHEVLYVNVRTGASAITIPPKL